uniref:Dscam n=1 Tax=Trichogramma kaykai TaxID=54128 RepID=A0ABD2WCT6_9HYME
MNIGDLVKSDQYLTTTPTTYYKGCLANVTINGKIQPFNSSGSIFPVLIYHGKVQLDCPGTIGISAATAADPLSVDIILVFFIVLLVAIIASFVIFRLRRQSKEKSAGTVMNKTTNASITGGNTHLLYT